VRTLPAAADLVGYLAASMVLATFCMRTMLPLRLVAVVSNLAFIAHGAVAWLMPILVLQAVLLPLDLWRLHELRRLVRLARSFTQGGLSMAWLMSCLKPLPAPAGTVLLRRGDKADRLYPAARGAVPIEGVGVTLRDGAQPDGLLHRGQRPAPDRPRRSRTAVQPPPRAGVPPHTPHRPSPAGQRG
jgi:hypothetical protein